MSDVPALPRAVTTYRDGPRKKAFSWSWSKMKNFETCPKKHYEVDLAKNHQDGGQGMEWGNQVHKAMQARLVEGVPLPPEMLDYEFWAAKVRGKLDASPTAKLLVEQKYAVNSQFVKTGYFAPDAWYRGIGDALVLDAPAALIVDWKTGKVQEESMQLALLAQCVFSHYPEIHMVVAKFIWLKEGAETVETFTRADMLRVWPGLLDRVGHMERAAVNMDYPPKPSGLCKAFCPVASCPYYKKGKPYGR